MLKEVDLYNVFMIGDEHLKHLLKIKSEVIQESSYYVFVCSSQSLLGV